MAQPELRIYPDAGNTRARRERQALATASAEPKVMISDVFTLPSRQTRS